MKKYFFTTKDDIDTIWQCTAPDADIAWNMFSLIKKLDRRSLEILYKIKIYE